MEKNRLGSLASFEVKGKTLKRAGGVMLAVFAAGLFSVPGVQAAITYSGDVTPADPSTWSSTTTPIIGGTASGSLAINGGSVLASDYALIGNSVTGNGTVTVDGAGTTWNALALVGMAGGTGILSITNGGRVAHTKTEGSVVIGENRGTGTIIVDGPGSIFSAAYSTELGRNLNTRSTGILTITNGGSYVGKNLSIGCDDLDTGRVTVDGAGSNLTGRTYYVSRNGFGTLSVTNGANASATMFRMGLNRGSIGTAVIDGAGTRLTASTEIRVGSSSYSTGLTQRLSISDGASVAAPVVYVYYSGSTLTADVGKGSSLTVGGGSGAVTNSGTIRLVVGAGAANGVYTPISYGTMTGTGAVQALGGKWDAATHTVTVSDADLVLAGRSKTIDTSVTQRLLIIDAPTAEVAGASFMGTDTSSTLTFKGSLLTAGERNLLQSAAGAEQRFLSGWDFTASGDAAGNPVYLSLFAGSGHSLYDLTVWRFDGTGWSKFDASDLAYDKTYASFTVNGFSGYAVTGTAPVPIPAAAWLLTSGIIGMVGVRRRFMA
jgi:T5SS/PEP-CTERM-associated repeat protein